MPMDEELKFLIESGKIDLSQVRQEMDMEKRKELLRRHRCNIWQSKDGRFYTRFDDGRRRYTVAKKTMKEMEDAIVKFQRDLIENPTLDELFDAWVDRKLELKKIKPSSHLRYKQVYQRFYKSYGKERIKDLRPVDFQDFLERQIPEHDLGSKSFSNLRTITKGFLKKAKRDGIIDWNVEEMITGLDVSKDDFSQIVHEDYEEVFDEAETAILTEHLNRNRDPKNMAILLMFFTGMRIGEAVSLRHDDLEHDGSAIRVRRTESTREGTDGKTEFYVSEYPKTRAGARDIAIPTIYQKLVQRLWGESNGKPYVFMQDGQRISAAKVRKGLDYLCRKLGIYHKSPHKIRKTYGTILMDAQVDRRFVEQQMGHTDISVSEKYYHRNRKSNEKKVEILDQISDFCYKKAQSGNLWQIGIQKIQ